MMLLQAFHLRYAPEGWGRRSIAFLPEYCGFFVIVTASTVPVPYQAAFADFDPFDILVGGTWKAIRGQQPPVSARVRLRPVTSSCSLPFPFWLWSRWDLNGGRKISGMFLSAIGRCTFHGYNAQYTFINMY